MVSSLSQRVMDRESSEKGHLQVDVLNSGVAVGGIQSAKLVLIVSMHDS